VLIELVFLVPILLYCVFWFGGRVCGVGYILRVHVVMYLLPESCILGMLFCYCRGGPEFVGYVIVYVRVHCPFADVRESFCHYF
jgi:hypothetical protein